MRGAMAEVGTDMPGRDDSLPPRDRATIFDPRAAVFRHRRSLPRRQRARRLPPRHPFDPEAIEEVYQRVTMVYERFPVVSKEAIDTILKLSPVTSNRNPYGVLDMSVLERIEKEGFVRSLYPAK